MTPGRTVRAQVPSLAQTIDRALPVRRAKIKRSTLVGQIAEKVETAQTLTPLVGVHARKVQRLARVGETLKEAAELMEDALSELCDLGAHHLEHDDPITHKPVISPDVGRPLYLACRGALAALQPPLERWQRVIAPRHGAPRAFKVELTAALERLVCKVAGYRKTEFEAFLDGLSHTHGLPKLSAAALKRRRTRSLA